MLLKTILKIKIWSVQSID